MKDTIDRRKMIKWLDEEISLCAEDQEALLLRGNMVAVQVIGCYRDAYENVRRIVEEERE